MEYHHISMGGEQLGSTLISRKEEDFFVIISRIEAVIVPQRPMVSARQRDRRTESSFVTWRSRVKHNIETTILKRFEHPEVSHASESSRYIACLFSCGH